MTSHEIDYTIYGDDLQAVDVSKHARDTRANQIVIVDHQHLNQSPPRCTLSATVQRR